MDYRTLINRPKTKRGRETLNRILSAAAQVFYEKGYHNASINDITKVAGVASGTFYVYFDGKYTLYKFLLLQCSHMIRKHLHQATQGCKSRQEAERVGMQAWLEFIMKNRYMYHIIWESLYVDKQLFVDYYTSFARTYVRGIEAAKDMGEIRPEVDSEVLAWALMGVSNFLGLNWGLFKDYATDMDKVVNNFMSIISVGIFIDQGQELEQKQRLPIQIHVEFDDDELADEEELELEPMEH